MDIIFRSPGIYCQQSGALENIGSYVEMFGDSALIVASPSAWERYKDTIFSSLADVGCEGHVSFFRGKTTEAAIKSVIVDFDANNCGVIVGLGGGNTIDTARAAADLSNTPLIVVPTAASNDSPCSALAVIHDDDGAVTELRKTRRNPDVVLVDTDVILDAPRRLLVAGMGDALATWFEASACKASGISTLAGGKTSELALSMAHSCYDTLIRYGRQAIHAVESGFVTDDFEKVVYACIYLSGFGFESGGVAAAHAINDGFSPCPEARHLYHGELVGFGTLSMLMLESSYSGDSDAVLDFMIDVGLPVTFEQLSIEPEDSLLMRVANTACAESVMKNMPFEVTPADVIRAMLKADVMGRERLEERGLINGDNRQD